MKKITLLMAAMLVSAIGISQTTISHSTSQVATQGSVACANAAGGFTTENNFLRVYVPADFGESGTISIEGGEFAYSFADNGGTDPSFPITVNAYSSDPAFPGGILDLIATGTVEVTAAGTLTVVPFTFDTPVNVDAADQVVLEMKIPSGETDVVDVRIGQNADGETDPTYISTDSSCGPIAITTFDDLGFPGNGILNLTVNDEILAVGDNLAELVSIFPNPASSVINVRVPSNVELTATTLFDIQGRNTGVALVNGQMDISNLSAGVYMINIKSAQGTLTQKVVKQ